MRILFLSNHFITLYKFRMELIQSILADGHEVFISTPADKQNGLFEQLGCRVYETELSRHGKSPLEDIGLLRAYERLIAALRPDIVFSYTIKPNIYGSFACKKYAVPIVCNVTGLGAAVENGGILQIITTELYRRAFAYPETIFCQNEENLKYFSDRKIGVGHLKLLPGSGVNLKRFYPLPYPEENSVEFVFISRVMKKKGIDQYLDAAKNIRARFPQTRFHVCGFCEEAYEKRLADLTADGTIIYHGMVDDIREVLKKVHCTIHPSYYPEGLSNVLLESCACARPIITTDRAGCREVLEDGVNGYVVRQQDSADLTKKIERFINLPFETKREMGVAGRTAVEQKYDRKIVIEAYQNEIGMINATGIGL